MITDAKLVRFLLQCLNQSKGMVCSVRNRVEMENYWSVHFQNGAWLSIIFVSESSRYFSVQFSLLEKYRYVYLV